MLTYLQTITTHLPFHLDDMDAANALFVRWHAHHDPEDKVMVDIWTYCYIYRYFLMKCVEGERAVVMDQLVARAFKDVERGQQNVQQPHLYASWVSKLCKNTFINYLRIDRHYEALEEDLHDAPAAHAGPYDVALIKQSLAGAIETLPSFLRDIARMRFMENLSYDEIQAATGKDLPILRSYTSKAISQLRSNVLLQQLHEELYA